MVILYDDLLFCLLHRYGNEAGQLTENMLYAGGNIAMTAHNANNFGVKAVAKRAAKDTGKAVLHDLKEKSKGQSGQGQEGQRPEKPQPPGSAGQRDGKR